MNVNHAVPSRDALRALSNLILETADIPICTSRGKYNRPDVFQSWRRRTVCTGLLSQIEHSKRKKHCSRSWSIKSRKQKHTSVAVTQETHVADGEGSFPLSIHINDLLQEKTGGPAIAVCVHDSSSKIASLALTSHGTDKPPSPIRDETLEKEWKHRVGRKVKTQPPTDLSKMLVSFYTMSNEPALSIKEWEVDGSPSTEDVARVSRRYSRTEAYVPPPFLSLKDPLPAISRNRYFESIPEHLSIAEAQRYFYICNYFLHQIDLVGLGTATERLCKYLQLYIHSSTEEDWRLVKLLHRAWSRNYASERCYRWWGPLIQASLHTNPQNLDAVSLLYVMDQESGTTPSRPAEWYLEMFCQKTSSTNLQLRETRKILDGTKLCGISPTERLLYPIITNTVRDGDPDLALQMLEGMTEKYGLTPDVHLLNTIATGYAKYQNWSSFESFLSSALFADVGVARYKPITFNVLLRTGLREYAKHNSAEEVFDFLIRHIQNYAIIPDDQLLDMSLQTFCEAKRYDLIRKWNRWKKSRFPLLYTTSSTASFAFNLSVSWRNSHASCSDILETCLALASGEIQDPFSVHLRSIAEEMVFLDLRHRYARLKKALGQKQTAKSLLAFRNWRSMFLEARQLMQSIKWAPKTERAKLLAQDLETQLEAVKSLTRSFAGQYSMAAVAARLFGRSNVQDTNKMITRGDGRPQKWSPSLQNPYLPAKYRDLVDEVSHYYYEQHEVRNTLPDYRLMLFVASRLAADERSSDAYNFLQCLYESRWRSQEIWTTEVYTKWLEVASTWRSPTAVRRVLWTIIEAPETIQINNTLLVLVQIARSRTHSTTSEQVSAHERQEMDYLVRRLRRRYWLQSGCPLAADVEASRFPAWSLIPVSIDL